MRRSANSIEPVRKALQLDVASTEASPHFTHEMGEWWPPGTHSIAALEASDIRFEPRADGTLMHLEHRDWEEFGATAGASLRADCEPGLNITLAPFQAPAMPPTAE
jgi:hypothetical protein